MASYEIQQRWVLEGSDDPDDGSRKEVQIVRHQDHDGLYIRTAYYGPSGRYGRDAPTFDIGEERQEELIDALREAFPRAREIRRTNAVEETLEGSEFDAGELRRLVELATEAGGVEELEARLG